MDISALFNNQVFSGGLLLGSIAGTIAWCKNIPRNLFSYFKSKIVFTLQITNKDCYFDWISSFLSKEYGDKKFRHVRPLICIVDDQPDVKFLPISGRYLVKYKGKWIFISCRREEQKLDGMSVGFTETISLTSLNKNKKIFQDFIKDVVLEYSNANKDKLIIKTFDKYGWIETNTRDKRNKDSLFYDDTIGKILGYKGVTNEDDTSNDIRLSSVEKGQEPVATMIYNKDGYTKYCKDYKEYWD